MLAPKQGGEANLTETLEMALGLLKVTSQTAYGKGFPGGVVTPTLKRRLSTVKVISLHITKEPVQFDSENVSFGVRWI